MLSASRVMWPRPRGLGARVRKVRVLTFHAWRPCPWRSLEIAWLCIYSREYDRDLIVGTAWGGGQRTVTRLWRHKRPFVLPNCRIRKIEGASAEMNLREGQDKSHRACLINFLLETDDGLNEQVIRSKFRHTSIKPFQDSR